MKRLVSIFSAIAALAMIAACEPKIVTVDIQVQLMFEGAPFAQEGIPVVLADDSGVISYEVETDAAGISTFTVLPGSYIASATYKVAVDGKRVAYNGSNNAILVAAPVEEPFKLELAKVESRQLVIKELYFGGCPKNEGTGAYSNDGYVIIYNNSDLEADATDLVFSFMPPYNGHATNKYIKEDGSRLYDNENWIPAAGAIWSFTSAVTIPAYSQVVVALFGAIDHTATATASVNLANPEYFWMSNSNVPQYSNAKYAVSELVPVEHYLTCYPINTGNAWVLSNNSPAFFIGNMSKAENERLSNDTANFDLTGGTTNVGWAAKFPKASVIGAVEVFAAANIDKSNARFTSDINTGYVAITNQKGYTVYRNVDKEATEALPENEGLLVYNYAGGTDDINGTTDPSGIDAEASIANGAHIIYSQTNDSGKDFHQRKVASLK